MILGVFVDDIIRVNDPRDRAEMDEFMTNLSKKFRIKDLGDAKSILGMRVTRSPSRDELILDQEAYTTRILEQYGYRDIRPADTPEMLQKISSIPVKERDEMNEKLSRTAAVQSSLVTIQNYSSVVGAIQYLANATRPDIAHAAGMLGRKSSNPDQADVERLKRVLHYLAGTTSLGIRYRRSIQGVAPLRLVAFSDSDWAGDSSDARSTTGLLFKLAGAAVGWKSQKQPTVSLSSTEAEYIAAAEGARRIVELRTLLSEMKCPQQKATPLLIDNQVSIRMIHEEGNEVRRKHINVKHHYIRENVNSGEFSIHWISTVQQQADIFTKALARVQFRSFRDVVMGWTNAASSPPSTE